VRYSATIWVRTAIRMRQGGRAISCSAQAVWLASALIDGQRQSASSFSVFFDVAWVAGRPGPRLRSRAALRR
jgi:hypothetical protein